MNKQVLTEYNGQVVKVINFTLGDCTNGGISSRKKELVIGKDVEVIRWSPYGKVWHYLRPIAPTDKGSVGYMNGGNTAWVVGLGEVNIHDRQETTEQNERLSI